MKQETKAPETVTDLEAVVHALATHERFLVVSHENPDGDALGSLLAMSLGLRALGKDVVMYLSGTAPLPAEFEFLSFEGLRASCRTTSASASCSPSTARTRAGSARTRRSSTSRRPSSTSTTTTTTRASGRRT